ncbi:MAG TPA: hypothetical protein VFB79_13175 [Candidatus Angelobacter sp.]|nr:hypothetical protein [Candidatus Angelobacter sp.]
MAIEDAPTVDTIDFDEKAAYNPDRPISSLIRTQLLHLHYAEHLRIPEKERTNTNINTLHTERQASEYIQKVTALLHKHGKKAAKGRKPAKKKSAMQKAASKSKKQTKPAQKKRRSRK